MRIVLVDTSRTVLKCVARMLEAGSHEVVPFTDGHDALAYIKSHLDIEAVITSAELVSMTGIEMCWETRLLANSRRPIYIVLMSSNYDRIHLAEALDMGADDFIGKPPVAEELHARLRSAERFVSMQHELIRLATTDPLTGVCNRRSFFERAQDVCARAGEGAALSAIMLDIDHFKKINDVYGHAVGDEALRGVTREASIEGTIIGRLGGEEFAILLENVVLPHAVAFAEHLRLKLAALRFETEAKVMTLTCSFGVSEWEHGDTIDTLLKRADAALYEAKNGGRNRVVASNTIVSGARTDISNSVVRSARVPA
jgi:two-component system cell cycle response regulator